MYFVQVLEEVNLIEKQDRADLVVICLFTTQQLLAESKITTPPLTIHTLVELLRLDEVKLLKVDEKILKTHFKVQASVVFSS